jgi:pimeloyl-ACP methyl ester carboxylesterase
MEHDDTRFVEGPQGRLRVDVGGEGGVPVLFLHGGGARLEQWSAQLRHARRTRRAGALDLRGHGRSDLPRDGNYSLTAMADDVLAVADAVAFPRFVLVAHSFGTAVAAQFAGRHAHRLAGLVLVDGGYWIPTSEETEELARGFEEANYRAFTDAWFEPILVNARPETRAAVLDSLRATPREVFVGSTSGSMGYDPRPAIRGFTGAKLVIAASALDGPTMFQRALPEIPFTLVDGVSHWVMMDAPDAFNARLDAFLEGIG